MKKVNTFLVVFSFMLSSCASYNSVNEISTDQVQQSAYTQSNYSDRLPQTIAATQKTIMVDPNVHAWGAYSGGHLVYSGLATSGGQWCEDVGRPCRTISGRFRIYRLGNFECRSKTYPVGKGGALMPYCMFFSGGYSLHGSTEMVDGNESHGCVRMTIPDAQWVRYNFATIGTQVIVKPY